MLFRSLLGKLEGVAKDFDRRVMEDSRNLLIVATSRIFCNLTRLHPSLDFADAPAPADVTSWAWVAATEYAKKFDQIEVGEGEGDDEDGAEEEEDAADGAGASGARRPEVSPVVRCSPYLSIPFAKLLYKLVGVLIKCA